MSLQSNVERRGAEGGVIAPSPQFGMTRRGFRILALTAIVAFPGPFLARVAFSQSTTEEVQALRRDIEHLRQGQEAIHKEVGEIKKLLQARLKVSAPIEKIGTTVSIGDITPKGNKEASLTLIEFSDYQCSYCRRHYRQTLPQLVTNYVDVGKLRYAFRDFPIESFHPLAFKAAEAARCAGEQDKYWEMHDQLFTNQQALQPEKLSGYAQMVRLDITKFKACLDGGKYAEAVRTDLSEGRKLGVTGTPAFILGISDSRQVKDAVIMRGAMPYIRFKAEIDKRLPETAEKKP